MEPKTAIVHVDYDAVIQGLLSSLRHHPEAPCTGLDGDIRYLRENRTIGVNAPRQSGKSTWVRRQLETNPDCLVVIYEIRFAHDLMIGLPPECRQRIIPSKKIAAHIGAYNQLKGDELNAFVPTWPKASTIIVDNASHVYNILRRGTFYKWLALHKDPNMTIIELG